MAAYEIDLNFISDAWALPSLALAQIYQELNPINYTSVTSLVLETCFSELFAEVQGSTLEHSGNFPTIFFSQAIKDLPSQLAYPYFAGESPFLLSEYQDWWISFNKKNFLKIFSFIEIFFFLHGRVERYEYVDKILLESNFQLVTLWC
jgi:hypothetical protein